MAERSDNQPPGKSPSSKRELWAVVVVALFAFALWWLTELRLQPPVQ